MAISCSTWKANRPDNCAVLHRSSAPAELTSRRMQTAGPTTSDHVTLSAADTGNGHPIVFLHGFPFTSGAWQKQIEVFRLNRRVIAPDLRGFGRSVAVPGPTTM